MSKRNTNVWQLAMSSALADADTTRHKNRFVIKSFFRIIMTMVCKNWAHTYNFTNVDNLVAECSGTEIKSHLLTAPKNATYLSPEYISKMIQIIADYVRIPLLSTLKTCNGFTFYSDETSDIITSIEQLAIYATFCYNNVLSKQFIGILPLSKLVGSHFSAENIMRVIENFFREKQIPIRNARFACMDNTNVNSGEKGGLKRFLEHAVPLLIWIGCNNHKIATSFKHLLPKFQCVFEVDVFLLNLWKYFRYHSLAMNFLDSSAEIYGDDHVVPVCPSMTRSDCS